MEYSYITKPCKNLDINTYEQCSILFSENYGRYSSKSARRSGENIRMSASLYKKYYADVEGMYVSLCYDEKQNLIGQAFFLRQEIPGKGVCSWVTQLVVHRFYRKRKIGTRLLHSAWGFSNYYAWGLATANAITLKTLESVTWRQITVEDMMKNIDVLKELMQRIPFADSDKVKVEEGKSQVFTDFYPEFESINKDEDLQIYTSRLGKIDSGYEWLAFTFASQEIMMSDERFNSFLEFSEQQLKEAYERMDMPTQPWTKGTDNELDFIVDHTGLKTDSTVLDLGCGQGRHSIGLAQRGFTAVDGVDFSQKNVERAKRKAVEKRVFPSIYCADARKLNLGRTFDVVLCLYDVIGSFRDMEDNKRILRAIKHHLKKDGKAVVSVMNMTLTEKIAKHRCSLKSQPKELLKLKPSDTMARSGNVFDPDYFLLNEDDGLVYRKEQFSEDGLLFSEYLVADKRYKREDFEKIAQDVGLKVAESRYVSAGNWHNSLEATNSHAKEILFVLTN